MAEPLTPLFVANSYISDVKEIPGRKSNSWDPKLPLTEKFAYWRACVLGSALFFWLLLTFVDLAKLSANYNQFEADLSSLPQSIRPHFETSIRLSMLLEVLVSTTALIAFFIACKGFTTRKDWKMSSKYVLQAWCTFLFAQGVLYVLFPVAAAIRNDLIHRDLCAGTLAGLVSIGQPMRVALNVVAQQGSPNLAPVLLTQPGENLQDWMGTKWCESNLNGWRDDVFGKEQNGGPASGDLGLVPTALNHLGAVFGTSIEACSTSTLEAQLASTSRSMAHTSDMGAVFLQEEDHVLEELTAAETPRGHDSSGRALLRHDCVGRHCSGSQRRKHGRKVAAVFSADGSQNVKDDLASPAALHRREHRMRANHSMFASLQLHQSPEVDVDDGGGGSARQQQAEDGATQRGGMEQKEKGVSHKHAHEMAICSAYKATNLISQVSWFAPRLVSNSFGMYSGSRVLLTVLPVMGSFFKGVQSGIDNVKRVLPTTSLPGYMLGMLVVGSVPALLAILGLLNQTLGSLPCGWGFTFWMIGHLYQLRTAAIYADVSLTEEAQQKAFTRAGRMDLFLTLLCYAGFAAYGVQELLLVHKSGGMDDTTSMAVGAIRGAMTPLNLIDMVLRYLLTNYLSLVASTDFIMMAVFDVMADKLHTKLKKVDEGSSKILIKQWNQFAHQPSKKVAEVAASISSRSRGSSPAAFQRRSSSAGPGVRFGSRQVYI